MSPPSVRRPADLDVVRDLYDRVADNDVNIVVTTGGRDVRTHPWLKAAMDAFADAVRGRGPVLDPGCGPGTVTAYLVDRSKKPRRPLLAGSAGRVWRVQDSNLGSFRDGFTVRSLWPLGQPARACAAPEGGVGETTDRGPPSLQAGARERPDTSGGRRWLTPRSTS